MRPVRLFLDRDDFFFMVERDADVLHLLLQGIDDFRVDKFQQARPLVDQHDRDPDHGQDRGVFRADHAAADDDDGVGNMFECQEPIRIDDRVIVEWNVRPVWPALSDGDDDEVRMMFDRCRSAC